MINHIDISTLIKLLWKYGRRQHWSYWDFTTRLFTVGWNSFNSWNHWLWTVWRRPSQEEPYWHGKIHFRFRFAITESILLAVHVWLDSSFVSKPGFRNHYLDKHPGWSSMDVSSICLLFHPHDQHAQPLSARNWILDCQDADRVDLAKATTNSGGLLCSIPALF